MDTHGMPYLAQGRILAERFRILEPVGRGGMGAVYRAEQLALEREVALKVLRVPNDQPERQAIMASDFLGEARAMARVSHPHVAAVHDFGFDTQHDPPLYWIAMELVHGQHLGRFRQEPVEPARLLHWCDQILGGLGAAHGCNVVHRDLKPSNIMLTSDAEGADLIKLVDFGLAVAWHGATPDTTRTPGVACSIVGTPRYMAPEQFTSAQSTPRVDLYALGIILFELLSGQPPYPGQDAATITRGHLRAPIPLLPARDGHEVPVEVEAFVRRLLAKDPALRPASAYEARKALRQIVHIMEQRAASQRHRPRIAHSHGLALSQGEADSAAPGEASGDGPEDFGAGALLAAGERERHELAQAMDRAWWHEPSGGVVLVEGPNRSGRTSLVQWALGRARDLGVSVWNLSRMPRWPHPGWLAELAAVMGDGHAQADPSASEDACQMQALAFTPGRLSPAEQYLLQSVSRGPWGDVSPPDCPYACLRRESHAEPLMGLIAQLALGQARGAPCLVVCDDLDEAPLHARTLFARLASALHHTPAALLLLYTSRPEAMPLLTPLGPGRSTRIAMEELSIAQTTGLLAQMCGWGQGHGHAFGPAFVSRLPRLPGDLWELAQELRHARLTPERASQLNRVLPEDWRERRWRRVLGSFDQPQALQALLWRAAILGRRFELACLERMLRLEPGAPWQEHAPKALQWLVKVGLFRRVRAGHAVALAAPGAALEFTHPSLWHQIMATLKDKPQATAMHRHAAQAMAEQSRYRPGPYSGHIAVHWQQAERPQAAMSHALDAACMALDCADHARAHAFLTMTRSLAPKPPAPGQTPETPALRAELDMAELERRMGQIARASQSYERLAQTHPDHSLAGLWALCGQTAIARQRGHIAQAEELVRRMHRGLVTLAQQDRSHPRPLHLAASLSWQMLGEMALVRGALRTAESHLQRALKHARHGQLAMCQARALRQLALLAWHRLQDDQCQALHIQAWALETHEGDLEARLLGFMDNARCLSLLGQPRQAEAWLLQTRAHLYPPGPTHLLGPCLLRLGELALQAHALGDARQYLEQALDALRASDDRHGQAHCLLALARLALLQGNVAQGAERVHRAVEGFAAVRDRLAVGLARLLVGRMEHALGKRDASRGSFASAVRMFEHIGARRETLTAKACLALTLEEHGNRADVDAIVEGELLASDNPLVPNPDFAWSLDALATLLSERHPLAAMQLDAMAETTRALLGQPHSPPMPRLHPKPGESTPSSSFPPQSL